jgi:hypothetical protein
MVLSRLFNPSWAGCGVILSVLRRSPTTLGPISLRYICSPFIMSLFFLNHTAYLNCMNVH